ncbi:hypothetical protein Tco_1315567 [Tanacetum coccineum]
MQAARDRQKSYADLKRKPMEFQVGDRVMLKVSPWKGVVRFGKRGKLNPRYVGPFKVLEKAGSVAYKLELPQELSKVHNTFHVSNLKKCYSDEPLTVPLEGLQVDDKLRFVEEPVEIMDREVKRLKQSRILIVKTWISQVARAEEPPTSFDELNDTSFDFSTFVMNWLKIPNLTQEILGGDLSRRYSTSVTKTKASTYDLKWIEDLVNNLWSPVQVKYDQHAYLGTSHWGPKRQRFYGYASNFTSSKDVYSRRRIIAVTRLKIMKMYDYSHLEGIEVRRDDQKLYTFK